MKVLVTDAGSKHSLAAIRSLGKKGIEVIAASERKHNMSFFSRYCKKHYIYSAYSNELAFINDILKIIEKEKCDVFLPIGFKSCKLASKYKRELVGHVKIAVADYEYMQIAMDKNKTNEFAEKNGIQIPKTIYSKSTDDLEKVSKELRYPVVIKAPEESGSVKYANNEYELKKLYKKVCQENEKQIIEGKYPQVQEYIPGEGYGFFALFNNGEPKAIFAHKRLHEYPKTGGPSTMAKSVCDQELKETGLKLLKALNWHGVAMVEFKKDERNGNLKLIEINPKFWGSLDLSIASGVDFPYLTCKMCMEGDIEPVLKYRENLIFRWIFPDFMHAITSNSLKEFLMNFLNRKIKDDLDIYDIKPNMFQFFKLIYDISSNIRQLRYPHGKPADLK